ncbi:4Fe-4S double cluster binding domain-containing protein [Ructibacterium gallinarum]|uniref:Epoxyqueuosine reductase n=1 Tax=Ructibacterium gallinarum TaxID=2779355 RepID=A0A9D5R859_9FIRM|nr:4Fe-4S double cluster binding domain-containing protein [Ructibacterium gallinarum]MBE5040061.1 epoxyqueuosine reductase [Ructibacterium gallinarum]
MTENERLHRKKITDFLIENGAGQVGFCHLAADNPFHLTYAVSYTIPLSDVIIDQIETAPTHTYFHHYRSVNALIDRLSLQCGRMLERMGYHYVPVPASQSVNGLQGIFSHKYAAVSAGLGTVGKSGLFLSKENGPRVRLGTVLTDCPFENPVSAPMASPCKNCMRCVNACPAMAITGMEWEPGAPREEIIDALACSQYMKQNFQQIGRGAVCGICMRVCPAGRKDGGVL